MEINMKQKVEMTGIEMKITLQVYQFHFIELIKWDTV